MATPTLKTLPLYAEQIGMETSKPLLESFFFACRLKNCAPKTMAVYGERLSYLMRFAKARLKSLGELTETDLKAYVAQILDEVCVVTVNGRIQVYKVFYRHLHTEGFIDADPMTAIRKLKQPTIIKDVITPEQLERVLAQINRKYFCGMRNFALILLTFDAMLRVGEALSIRVIDLDLQSGLIKVYGKGRKERFVAFSPATAKILHAYIARFRVKIPGDLLFCTREGNRIAYRQTHRIFSRPAMKIGLRLHPHLARHSGATQFARSGGSLAVLQRALGHSTLAVTERYIHLGDQDIRDAYLKYAPAANIRV